MPSFNQSPLGQASVAFTALSVTLGSDAPLASSTTSSSSFISAGDLMPDIDLPPSILREQDALSVLPHYRRMGRIVGAPAT